MFTGAVAWSLVKMPMGTLLHGYRVDDGHGLDGLAVDDPAPADVESDAAALDLDLVPVYARGDDILVVLVGGEGYIDKVADVADLAEELILVDVPGRLQNLWKTANLTAETIYSPVDSLL